MRCLIGLALMAAAVSPAAANGNIAYYVFTNVNLVPMDREVVIPNQAVVVSGSFLSYVGDAASLPESIPESIPVINAGGGYLMPGLAEMHAHVPGLNNGEQYVQDLLNLYLVNGITKIRGMLGQPWHLDLRYQLKQNEWTGPTLITSGPSFNGNSVTSPAQAREKAIRQKLDGYDFLKLHPGLTRGEYIAIATAAREEYIPIAGHVSSDVGIMLTLESRQATIDHLDGYAQAVVPKDHELFGAPAGFFGFNLASGADNVLIRSLAKQTADARVWNVPTQSLIENLASGRSAEAMLARPEMIYVRPATRTAWENRVRDAKHRSSAEQRAQFIDVRRRLIKALHDQGAGLLLGSDAPQVMNVPGFSIHEELALLVAAGLTPYQALKTGTVNVAKFLGKSNSGMIRRYFEAEFVVLKANPLKDIGATRQVLGVMHNGRWYDEAWIQKTLEGIRERKI